MVTGDIRRHGKQQTCTYQHIAVFDVEVEEEEEGDEEAEEGDGGAFPQTPHLVQGFPHQPHAARALAGICGGRTWQGRVSWLAPRSSLSSPLRGRGRGRGLSSPCIVITHQASNET